MSFSRSRRPLVLTLSSAGLGLLMALTAAAQDPLVYRLRGDHHEGTKPKPVSGYDIELLGTLAEAGEPRTELPESLTARFFLERGESVYLTVRERHPETFYWLDKLTRTSWSQHTNVFTWQSAAVVRPLGLKPSQLLILARLAKESPSVGERVAPVIFNCPTAACPITAYRFTFKTNATAKIRYRIFGPASKEEPLIQRPEQRRTADIPFDIRWEAGQRPDGLYRLELEGYFLSDNGPILQKVDFFHSRSWPPL